MPGSEKKVLLITADIHFAAPLLERVEDVRLNPLHLPLESFVLQNNSLFTEQFPGTLKDISFISYENLRNAYFFIKWCGINGFKNHLRQFIHLCLDKPTANFLENEDIPAILPKPGAKPIDLLEFILRISTEGTVLSPGTKNRKQELPGLLQELELPFIEFDICREENINPDTIVSHQNLITKKRPDLILFHSRSSVNRVEAAFPAVMSESVIKIAANAGTAQKLISKGYQPDEIANGTWSSVTDQLEKQI
ncbi:MAG TPA: hypothetical protein VKM36_06585 [Balneolaceae bacterium]|nr:hypothetical protein [Balneolaceae bacterium]